ncbi:hypothetical protein RTP6_007477 [Batrachochytrium dendrobatidis]
MSIAQYGKKFPVLLRMTSPRGHVELLQTIGKGNYGAVYKGKMHGSTFVAVKVVFLKEDELRETLLEMEILERCNHPNITKYYDCYLKGLDLWICMEFCGGGSLDSIYRTIKNPLSEDQIAAILYESLNGLDYLHNKANLIHRDIKAGNVLLTDEGQVKLADFGVSAQLQSPSGRANTFIGTPYWMAPEVIMTDPDSTSGRDATYDSKSDIWSLGITAIEIAEKNPPLSDIHPMRALQLIPKSEIGFAKPKNFSKPFIDFVSQCLIKSPAKRPSAAELLEHPFFAKIKGVSREKIVSDLVAKAKTIAEKKKAGFSVDDDDDDDDDRRAEAPPKLIAETVKQAEAAKDQRSVTAILPTVNSASLTDTHAQHQQQQNKIQLPSSQTQPQSHQISPTDFPVFVNAVQSVELQVFEPTPITASRNEFFTADVLDGIYMLLGGDKGLYFIDLTEGTIKQPVPLIRDVRFRQIEILHEYGVIMALSGKRDHVRQYKLASIRRLIRYLLGDNIRTVAKMNMNLPMAAALLDNEQIASTPVDDFYANLNRDSVDEAALVSRWTTDFIKIIATRDTKSFLIEKTETTIYLTVLFRQDIVLFEWAKEPYLKFMKLKAFWLPETPQFLMMFHDGLVARELCLGYTGEMNMVDVEHSKVKEILVHRDFRERAGAKPRWRNFSQIPFSHEKLQEMMRNTVRPQGTVNRKLAAVSGSNAYTAAAQSAPPIDRYFLGTYDRVTKVVDITAQPMMGSGVGGWKNGVCWSEPPVHLILRPLEHVIAAGINTIEIVNWKSAELRQRLTVDSSCSLRVLCPRQCGMIVAVDRKKKGSFFYWMREKPGTLKTAPKQIVAAPVSTSASFATNSSAAAISTASGATVVDESHSTKSDGLPQQPEVSSSNIEDANRQPSDQKSITYAGLPSMPVISSSNPSTHSRPSTNDSARNGSMDTQVLQQQPSSFQQHRDQQQALAAVPNQRPLHGNSPSQHAMHSVSSPQSPPARSRDELADQFESVKLTEGQQQYGVDSSTPTKVYTSQDTASARDSQTRTQLPDDKTTPSKYDHRQNVKQDNVLHSHTAAIQAAVQAANTPGGISAIRSQKYESHQTRQPSSGATGKLQYSPSANGAPTLDTSILSDLHGGSPDSPGEIPISMPRQNNIATASLPPSQMHRPSVVMHQQPIPPTAVGYAQQPAHPYPVVPVTRVLSPASGQYQKYASGGQPRPNNDVHQQAAGPDPQYAQDPRYAEYYAQYYAQQQYMVDPRYAHQQQHYIRPGPPSLSSGGGHPSQSGDSSRQTHVSSVQHASEPNLHALGHSEVRYTHDPRYSIDPRYAQDPRYADHYAQVYSQQQQYAIDPRYNAQQQLRQQQMYHQQQSQNQSLPNFPSDGRGSISSRDSGLTSAGQPTRMHIRPGAAAGFGPGVHDPQSGVHAHPSPQQQYDARYAQYGVQLQQQQGIPVQYANDPRYAQYYAQHMQQAQQQQQYAQQQRATGGSISGPGSGSGSERPPQPK